MEKQRATGELGIHSPAEMDASTTISTQNMGSRGRGKSKATRNTNAGRR